MGTVGHPRQLHLSAARRHESARALLRRARHAGGAGAVRADGAAAAHVDRRGRRKGGSLSGER